MRADKTIWVILLLRVLWQLRGEDGPGLETAGTPTNLTLLLLHNVLAPEWLYELISRADLDRLEGSVFHPKIVTESTRTFPALLLLMKQEGLWGGGGGMHKRTCTVCQSWRRWPRVDRRRRLCRGRTRGPGVQGRCVCPRAGTLGRVNRPVLLL